MSAWNGDDGKLGGELRAIRTQSRKFDLLVEYRPFSRFKETGESLLVSLAESFRDDDVSQGFPQNLCPCMTENSLCCLIEFHQIAHVIHGDDRIERRAENGVLACFARS